MRFLPILLLIGAAAFYASFLSWVLQDESSPQKPPNSNLATAMGWLVLPAGVVFGFMGVWAGGFGVPLGIALVVVCTVLWMPLTIAVAVAIPLARPRIAYALARLSTLRAEPDPVGVAMAVAARAAGRAPSPDPSIEPWLEGRAAKRPLTPGMVLALGLSASLFGHDEEAREMIALVDAFDDTITDPWITRWAHEWLAVEAAERGDWVAVHRATHGLGRRSTTTRWLGAVAGRFLDRPDAPTEANLDALWQSFPGHRKVADLHDQAVAYTGLASEPVAATSPLQAHVHAVAHPTSQTLAQAVHLWSAADVDPAIVADALKDLQGAASRAGLPLRLPKEGPMCPSDVLGGDPLEAIEIASNRLAHRLQSGDTTDRQQDLRDWLHLAGLLEAVRRHEDPALLRLAFRPIYSPLCALSVSLYNDRNERHLSNALTRWLLFLAQEVGDTRAVALQTQNLAASRRHA